MMCDNPKRFNLAFPHRIVDEATKSIVYSGHIGCGRWISIIELCEAAKLLNTEGFKTIITVLATSIPKEAVNKLRGIGNLQILPGPSHKELPSFLKGADILFLPETFDEDRSEEIRLSISTKAHFYMMSEKPILVYASPKTGIVHYAKEGGWAYIVDEHNPDKLVHALRILLTNSEFCKKMVNQGIEVVAKNHMAEKVRVRFLSILKEQLINAKAPTKKLI
jgi:glycosyltransferase involved in cell wall biosynthesis